MMNVSNLSSPRVPVVPPVVIPGKQHHLHDPEDASDDNKEQNPEEKLAFNEDVARLQDLLSRVDLGTKEKYSTPPSLGKETATDPTAAAACVNKPTKSRTRRGGTRRHRTAAQPTTDKDANVGTVRNNHIIPRSGWERRGSMASCSSMSSVEEPPKRKIIRLRPHRSQDLYDAQRQDEELRTLIKARASSDLTVRKVHGKSLVFYDNTRIYIPQSLRAATIKYYTKNYKYSHKQRMEESCYWPNMERDHRREFQWKILITHPDTKESKLVYDSDDYEFPSH